MVSDMHNRERPRVCVSRRTADGTRWNFSFREMVGANPERTEFFRIKSARRLTMKRRKKKMLRKMRMEEEREGHGVEGVVIAT